jgi:5-keto 4-deoxyuronate isomerase
MEDWRECLGDELGMIGRRWTIYEFIVKNVVVLCNLMMCFTIFTKGSPMVQRHQ